LAAKLGFDGVQVSLGRKPVSDKLPLDDASDPGPGYLAGRETARHRPVGHLPGHPARGPLEGQPRAQKWVADSIPITANLKAGVVLLPFFGKASLTNHAEMDYVAGF
jgi:L-ribulose-5-phosphate 3-epimerase